MKCDYKAGFIIVVFTLIVSLIPGGSSFAFYQEEEEMTPEEYEAYNEQYEAYMAATEEQDPLKRGEMLIEFLKKYPNSKDFESYVVDAYNQLLFSCAQDEKYQELEVLSEKWLERNPDDIQTIGLAASAAIKLKDNEKSLKYLQKIYEKEPTVDRALLIAQIYDEMGNFEKYVEWCEVVFTYPEYSVDYTLRYNLVQRFLEKKDMARAGTYAKKTLEVLDAAEKPDAETQKKFRTIRRNCYHILALNLFEQEKYKEAIKCFKDALNNEKYQEGFYYIGECYWRLTDPETAPDWFGAAELMGGPLTKLAKENKEKLYKPLHNETLVGIEKVNQRAQAILDSYPNPDGAQKKTELSKLN
jgi:tetratricopeptide (TPR) repeat protein